MYDDEKVCSLIEGSEGLFGQRLREFGVLPKGLVQPRGFAFYSDTGARTKHAEVEGSLQSLQGFKVNKATGIQRGRE